MPMSKLVLKQAVLCFRPETERCLLFVINSGIKQNRNGSSLVQFTFHRDLTVMILHGVLDDGQTKAGAAGLLGVALVHTIETLKYFVLMFGSNANAGITDAYLNSTLLFRNRNLYLPPLIVVLNGIVAEIVNNFVQQSTYTVDNAIIAGHFQRNILQFCGICKSLANFFGKNSQRNILMGHFSTLVQLRQTDDVIDQINKSAGFTYQIGGDVYNANSMHSMMGNKDTSFGQNRLAFIADCYKYYGFINWRKMEKRQRV